MMHTYHGNLTGYDERNVLHDGCGECHDRSKLGVYGLLRLDNSNVQILWDRMIQVKVDGDHLHWVSECDFRLIAELYAIYILNERIPELFNDR